MSDVERHLAVSASFMEDVSERVARIEREDNPYIRETQAADLLNGDYLLAVKELDRAEAGGVDVTRQRAAAFLTEGRIAWGVVAPGGDAGKEIFEHWTERASKAYAKSAALVPTPGAFYNLGLAYANMGQSMDAMEAFRQAEAGDDARVSIKATKEIGRLEQAAQRVPSAELGRPTGAPKAGHVAAHRVRRFTAVQRNGTIAALMALCALWPLVGDVGHMGVTRFVTRPVPILMLALYCLAIWSMVRAVRGHDPVAQSRLLLRAGWRTFLLSVLWPVMFGAAAAYLPYWLSHWLSPGGWPYVHLSMVASAIAISAGATPPQSSHRAMARGMAVCIGCAFLVALYATLWAPSGRFGVELRSVEHWQTGREFEFRALFPYDPRSDPPHSSRGGDGYIRDTRVLAIPFLATIFALVAVRSRRARSRGLLIELAGGLAGVWALYLLLFGLLLSGGIRPLPYFLRGDVALPYALPVPLYLFSFLVAGVLAVRLGGRAVRAAGTGDASSFGETRPRDCTKPGGAPPVGAGTTESPSG